jgi:hypothetical protein
MQTFQVLSQLADAVIAAPVDPSTAPTEAPTGDKASFINTAGVVTFAMQWIAPLFLAYLALIFLGRAKGGQVSKVLTSSGIAIVGICFLAGAFVLPLLGDDIVNLFVTSK